MSDRISEPSHGVIYCVSIYKGVFYSVRTPSAQISLVEHEYFNFQIRLDGAPHAGAPVLKVPLLPNSVGRGVSATQAFYIPQKARRAIHFDVHIDCL